MKRSLLFLPVMILLLVSVAWISSGFRYTAKTISESFQTQQTDPAAVKYPKGAQIYKEKCTVCHQATGLGIPNAFPPLKGSDYLMADKVRAVAQVLNGSNEPMKVNGVTYTTPMPPQVNTKEDAVAVINYILNAWGNNGGTVTIDQVKNITIKPR
jgi:nitrite reductase (NO-forming)